MKVEISRVAIPEAVTDPDAVDFVEACDVANSSELETWGSDDFVSAPEAALPMFAGGAFHSRFVWLARLDGLPVGRVVVTFPLEENATNAALAVDVVPVARGRGIGSALLTRGEDFILTGGQVDVVGLTQHRLDATSVGFTPPDDSDSRFLARRGYRLAQLHAMDELTLPLPPGRRSQLVARPAQHPAADYELVHWWRHAPARFVDRYARLHQQMTQDSPHDGVVVEPEHWTAARVRETEDRAIERGAPVLVTAARHAPSGALVGYTEIALADASHKVEQHDTLVVSAHRGHGLGLRLKLANLAALEKIALQVTTVLTRTTPDNAPMRRINTALGFAPRGLLANWHKRLE